MKRSKLLGWGTALGFTATGAWLYSKRASSYPRLHPDLRSPLLRLRSPSFTPILVSLMQKLPVKVSLPTDVHVDTHYLPDPPGAPDVLAYVYRPLELQGQTAALLYIHGGGFVTGSADTFHDRCARFARELGVVVVNVDYRLAPQTPFPGPLEDCYAALKWMKEQATILELDPKRIAIVGESAGGNLAAALAQLAHDRGEVEPIFQLLYYPMLDDRTVLQRDYEGRGEFVWRPQSNQLGWTAYLGHSPTLADAPEYAAPARRQDLAGLAPAWIGVGTLDLFYPEDKAYALRLNEAGVPCEFDEVAGAFHGVDLVAPGAAVSEAFFARSLAALRRGLGIADSMTEGSPT